MDVELTLSGDHASADALRSLWASLVQDGLGGHVEPVEAPPAPGRLGPVLEALRIVAEPSAAVLGAALLAWVRSRTGSFRLEVHKRDGEKIIVEAEKVRGLKAKETARLVEDLVHRLGDKGPDGPARPKEIGSDD